MAQVDPMLAAWLGEDAPAAVAQCPQEGVATVEPCVSKWLAEPEPKPLAPARVEGADSDSDSDSDSGQDEGEPSALVLCPAGGGGGGGEGGGGGRGGKSGASFVRPDAWSDAEADSDDEDEARPRVNVEAVDGDESDEIDDTGSGSRAAAPPPGFGRQVALMSSSAPARRRSAMERLAAMLGESPPGRRRAAAELLKPALKRFGDPSERCREAAVALVAEAVTHLGDMVPWLPYVLPVLAFRVSPDSRPEPSEEVRLALFGLLRRCLELSMEAIGVLDGPSAGMTPEQEVRLASFGAHLRTVCVVAVHGLADRRPEVQAAAAGSATLLARAFPGLVRGYSNEMVALLMPVLVHRLARVRAAALEAVRRLVPCGAHERVRDLAAFREHNLIDTNTFYTGETRTNYMALLVVDRNERVRAAFFGCLCGWMSGELAERFDYETLIMPYVLTGLFDASAAVRGLASACVSLLGAEYERDREEELRDEAHYGDGADGGDGGAWLPAGFERRPRLGERRVVGRFVDRLMPAVCAELADWKEQARGNSLQLLVVLVVHGEGAVTKHVPRVLPALLRAETVGDPGAARALDDAAALLGRHAAPGTLAAALADAVAEAPTEAAEANAMALAARVLRGVAPGEAAATVRGALRDAVAEGGFERSRHPSVRAAAAALLEACSA